MPEILTVFASPISASLNAPDALPVLSVTASPSISPTMSAEPVSIVAAVVES